MPRRTSRKSSTSVPVFKKQTQTPQKETRQSSSPSVLSTVGQGVSLGAGAAIGSSMVHGALGSIMDSKVIEACDNFGICIRCKTKIPIERILIIPETEKCVHCSGR